MMALADQASGRTIGFANPALYGTLKSHGYYPANPGGAFHDVTYHPFGMVRVNYNNSIDATAGTSRYLRYTDQTGTSAHHARLRRRHRDRHPVRAQLPLRRRLLLLTLSTRRGRVTATRPRSRV